MTIDDAINVYVDGSSLSGPRAGGIGVRLVVINESGNEVAEDVPLSGYKGATNNQMELSACIEGIKEALKHPECDSMKRIAIHTDSGYVVDNYPRALFNWSSNNWRNRYGKPVDNALLWKLLVKIVRSTQKRIDFHWIKGHSGDIHNKAADKLARQSARTPTNRPMSNVKVRRKISHKSVDPGSVVMQGQRLSIRVITDEYLKLQKCYKYKYEVISKASPYFRNVDFAYSDIMLNAGHCYFVRFNEDSRNPVILKVFRELMKTKA